MGQKLRQGKPWMPGFRYSALLTPISLNLMVTDVEKSVQFYQDVLQAEIHYWDVDFAAMRVSSVEVMLHADHTHTEHEWHDRLVGGVERGVGAQIRLLGMNRMKQLHGPVNTGRRLSLNRKIKDMAGARLISGTAMAMNGPSVS